METVDYEQSRDRVVVSLRALESALDRLLTALAHGAPWVVSAESGATDKLRRVCDAYGAINLRHEDSPNQSVVELAVVGVDATVIALAEAVNRCKSDLRLVCAPLQGKRKRLPGPDGVTQSVPWVRAILRSIQRSDLNLLAAYRKIPLITQGVQSVSYTNARTRAVYRKTVSKVGDMLRHNDSPYADADRSRLAALSSDETHLALVREHYTNVRANVLLDRVDDQGRRMRMLPAELPIMFVWSAGVEPPKVNFVDASDDAGTAPRRVRAPKLEAKPYLQSLPVYRYRG